MWPEQIGRMAIRAEVGQTNGASLSDSAEFDVLGAAKNTGCSERQPGAETLKLVPFVVRTDARKVAHCTDPSACASTRLQQSPLARLNGSQAVALIACQVVPGIPWSKPGMAAGLKVALGLTREAAGAPDQDSDATALTELDG
jgi:hypothetical protein